MIKKIKAKCQPIAMIRGTSDSFPLTLADDDGAPYTLKDGEKLIFGIKETVLDKKPLFTKELTQVGDGYELRFVPSDTASLTPGLHHYDIGLRSGSDFFNIIPLSEFEVLPGAAEWSDTV